MSLFTSYIKAISSNICAISLFISDGIHLKYKSKAPTFVGGGRPYLLILVKPQIYIFKRFYSVAHGNIVLFVGYVGNISGGPNSLFGSTRVLVVYNNFAVVVQINQILQKSTVGYGTYLYKHAAKFQFMLFSFFVLVNKSAYQFISLYFGDFNIFKRFEFVAFGNILNRYRIGFKFITPFQEGYLG